MLAAQTRLARELYRRPELYELYLVELLTLFADKGIAIQNLAISDHLAKVGNIYQTRTYLTVCPDGRRYGAACILVVAN